MEEERGNELGEGHAYVYQKFIEYLEENKIKEIVKYLV